MHHITHFTHTLGYPSRELNRASHQLADKVSFSLAQKVKPVLPNIALKVAAFATRLFCTLIITAMVITTAIPLQIAYSFIWIMRYSLRKEETLFQLAKQYLEKGYFSKGIAIIDQLARQNPENQEYQALLSTHGLKTLEFSQICRQYPQENHLTDFEENAVRLLSSHPSSLSNEEEKNLSAFFTFISQNSDFNRRISQLLSEDTQPFDLGILYFLRDYSFKSNFLHKATLLEEKIAHIKSKQGKNLEKSERLSIHDMHLIESFCRMQPFFDHVNHLGLCKKGTPFYPHYQAINNIAKFKTELNQRYIKESGITSGDMVLDLFKKYKDYSPKMLHFSANLHEHIVGHRFMHAAMTIEKDGSLQVAEIAHKVQRQEFRLERFCIANFYRLDFDKLLTKRGHFLLSRIARSQDLPPSHFLKSKFQSIVNDFFIHDERFDSISNHMMRKIGTVLQSHTHQSIHNDFLRPELEHKQYMVCSEFVGKVFAYSLKKLEEELRNEHPHLRGENLLVEPISVHENFSAMHIERLHTVFKDYLIPIEHPNFVREMIDID